MSLSLRPAAWPKASCASPRWRHGTSDRRHRRAASAASSWARSSRIHARVAQRGREQPGRLRRQVELGGVGAAHDAGELQQRLRLRARAPRAWCRRCSARRGGSRTRPRCRTAWRRTARRPAATSDGATNRNTAAGSTKRRISHGQAMRSTLGLARVTQTVRPLLVAGGQLVGAHEQLRRPCARPRSRLRASARRARRGAARRRRPGSA